MFTSVHFNEFVIKCSKNAKIINDKLLKKGIQSGLILDENYPKLKNCLLFGATELHTESDIERLISALKEVA